MVHCALTLDAETPLLFDVSDWDSETINPTKSSLDDLYLYCTHTPSPQNTQDHGQFAEDSLHPS